MDAARTGDAHTLRSVLRAGVDVNVRDPHGSTALAEAIEAQQPECVELLLGAGADPNANFMTGHAVPIVLLYRAVSSHDTQPRAEVRSRIVSALIEAGADVNAAFAVAIVYYRDVAAADLLLALGAGVDDGLEDGTTALMAAAEMGEVKMVEYLLSHGSDPCRRRKDGASALTLARVMRASTTRPVDWANNDYDGVIGRLARLCP